MDGDLVLSLVLFGLFFFALFYCYYSAQVRIKQEEYTLSACERGLLQYHHHRFGGQEINTVSSQAERYMNDLPPDYVKDTPPPSYEVCISQYEHPPPYEMCPHHNAICSQMVDKHTAQLAAAPCDPVSIPMDGAMSSASLPPPPTTTTTACETVIRIPSEGVARPLNTIAASVSYDDNNSSTSQPNRTSTSHTN